MYDDARTARSRERHGVRATLAALSTAGLIIAAVYWALITEITVPLLLVAWPLTTAAVLLWRGRCQRRQLTARLEEHERRMVEARAPRNAWLSATGGHPDQRIGTAERQAVTDALSEHYVAGRLDPGTYESRREAAETAVYRRDLTGLIDDLPNPTH